MSLDGYVAGPGDNVEQVFKWYSSGDVTTTVSSGDQDFRMSREGAAHIEKGAEGAGVLVTARRTFDLAHAWGGKHPLNVPVVVVTHRIPADWASKKDSPFTFVTEGVEAAIAKARQIAGKKDVVIGAPSVLQQCIQLGLLDEIVIDLAPVVLGGGIRLFDHMGTEPLELEIATVSSTRAVTHITYRVPEGAKKRRGVPAATARS
jgi:dihydrofolate reductase